MRLFIIIVFFAVSYVYANDCDDAFNNKIPIHWVEKMRQEAHKISQQQKLLNHAAQYDGKWPFQASQSILKNHVDEYSYLLKHHGIYNQEDTGKCWNYTCLKMLESNIIQTNLFNKNFKFSHTYINFYEKLERSNYYLNRLVNLFSRKSLPADPRSEIYNSTVAIEDGGFFHEFDFLIRKYGIVPENAMPATYASLNSTELIMELQEYLLNFALKLGNRAYEMRGLDNLIEMYLSEQIKTGKKSKAIKSRALTTEEKQELYNLKQDAMEGVWKILSTHLGIPPENFQVRYKVPTQENEIKDKNQPVKLRPSVISEIMTPTDFTEKVLKYNSDDYVVITSFASRRYNQLYSYKGYKAGVENPYYKFLNISKERLLELTIKTLDLKFIPWFAASIGKGIDHNTGIMHPSLKNVEGLYGFDKNQTPKKLSPQENLFLHSLLGEHAMAFVGYDKPENSQDVIKLAVANSWGKDFGDKGIYHMYKEWFETYVLEVVVPKEVLSEKELELWKGKSVTINASDEYY